MTNQFETLILVQVKAIRFRQSYLAIHMRMHTE